jgi:TrmH family RNA methyltransferase
MIMKKINSAANPLIKEAARLKKAGARQERGRVMIDGAREIQLAIRSGLVPETLFYCPALAGAAAGEFFGLADEKIVELTAAVFREICYKDNPDGFLAVARRPERGWGDIKLGRNPLLIILEKVEKPGNLGAILRTASAAGVAAVIINDSQTDIYNPNVIRASEGYVFAETVVSASLADTIAWLKKNKIKSFGAATDGTKDYTGADWRGPSAIVLGSEADGLSPAWRDAAAELVKIPMAAGLDSLNVSVAAAVIVFEAVRQRKV